MKLSGWPRIGIVVSLLWLVAVIGFAFFERFHSAPFGEFRFIEFVPYGPQTVDGFTAVHAVLRLGRIAWIGLFPVLIGWVGVFLVVQIVRWVKRGFQQ